MKIISTEDAPKAIGPYSQAVVSNGFVFLSGQIPINPKSGVIEEKGIVGQTEQVIKNIGAVLDAAGCGFDNVIKTTCFLADIKDFASFNLTYEQHFFSKPSRSLVEVGALPKGSLVEIEVIAEIK